ncbi:unnamed protein product [Ambrosiozyma monospora]|uniref:Unnamed protein product n=1 Tax=Ambrosiozyma monospora TaxID=43982 RepID=A0A9W6YQ11_AMBMO|nr:unnamed protein product [Ambrosiozyma monospora]
MSHLISRQLQRRVFLSSTHTTTQLPKLLYYSNQARLFHSTNSNSLDNPYSTLGVEKNASSSQIKKAYYKLAKKYHPDINKEKGAETKFHSIQEAYDILSDPQKKQQYDQFGASAFNPNAGPGGFGGYGQAGGNPFGGAAGGNPFGGFAHGQAAGGDPFAGFGFSFEDLFGGMGQNGRSRGRSGAMEHLVGEDIEVLKTISFREAIFGTTASVTYNPLTKCGPCSGSGLKQGKKKSTCHACGGTGSQVHYLQAGFQMASTCKTCGGSGVTINPNDACGTCHGEGVTTQRKQTEVQLPKGIRDGARIRVSGAGDAPHSTSSSNYVLTNGDLIIRIKVKPDPDFIRDDRNNLIYTCQIPMTTAALGGVVQIPTLDGPKINLKVPSGSEDGRSIRIPDKGVPYGRSGSRGDLMIVLKVKPLKPTNATQTALLEALADAFDDECANRLDPTWKPLENLTKNHSSTNTSASTEKKNDGDDDAATQKDKNRSEDSACDHSKKARNTIENFLSNAFKKVIGHKDSNGDSKSEKKDNK